MAETESLVAAGVPVLLRHPPHDDGHQAAPLIVLWHGFGPPENEAALLAALPLDEVQAYKAYLGLPGGGDRPKDVDAGEGPCSPEDFLMQRYLPALDGAVRDLPGVIEALKGRARLRLAGGIGLFGVAEGGAAVQFALLAGRVGIAAAVTLNAPKNPFAAVAHAERQSGAPYTWSAAARAAARRADPLGRAADIAQREPPAALLLLHGALDVHFPPADTRALRDALRPHYAQRGYPEWLVDRTLPGLGHHLGPPATEGPQPEALAGGMALLRETVVEWFRLHLDRPRL